MDSDVGLRRSDGNFHKIYRTPANIRINLISPETRVMNILAANGMVYRYYFYAICFEIHAKI